MLSPLGNIPMNDFKLHITKLVQVYHTMSRLISVLIAQQLDTGEFGGEGSSPPPHAVHWLVYVTIYF